MGEPCFESPETAFNFIAKAIRIQKSLYSLDELNYILTANHKANAAPKEAEIVRFLLSLRKSLEPIATEYDPRAMIFYRSLHCQMSLLCEIC